MYTVDITPPGCLHAKVLRSDRAHARIRDIDTSRALGNPGVVAVVTSADLAGLYPRFGHIVPDHCILAIDKVRYYGEPVALVVADDVFAAADALEQIVVEYEELPAVLSVEQALAADAPLVHETKYRSSGDESFSAMAATPDAEEEARPDNIQHEHRLEWGDVDAVFAAPDVTIVEGRTHFPMLYPYAMEPYNAVATYS
jgi:CO/xanthine dehydrogenase Mo-binding subunit